MEKKKIEMKDRFVPCTMERKVSSKVVWRPVKMWHTGIYAGEKLTKIPGTSDGSGCMFKARRIGVPTNHEWDATSIPLTVTHRMYWHIDNPDEMISCFLSYPDAMGCSGGEYFWEVLGTSKDGDIERFFGPDSEARMEKKIMHKLNGMWRAKQNANNKKN